MGFNTGLLHKCNEKKQPQGATVTPIFQTSAFACESAEQLEKVFNNRAPGYSYTRISNPTVESFESRVAAMENGLAAVACSSGMAAVTMSLLNILKSGDELISSTALFGGTIDLFGDLAEFGITTRFVSDVTAENVEKAITPRTKAVFTELIGNPRLNVADLESVSAVCRCHGVPLIVDSTTATPYMIRPFDFGANIVVHSSSKYINGGGNSISGVIIDNGSFDFSGSDGFDKYRKFGKFAYIAKLRSGIWRNTGACLSPMNAFMNIVGLDTLGLRMERECFNALRLSEFFERKGISVNYPALPGSPYYELCKKQFGGRGGAIITIRPGSKEKAFKLINNLKYACIATNIGDVRTLVIHAASTIYTHSTDEQRAAAGVYEDTIRISVGIEDIEDLIEDFCSAIDNM